MLPIRMWCATWSDLLTYVIQIVQSLGLSCHQYIVDTHFYLLLDGHPDSAPVDLNRVC